MKNILIFTDGGCQNNGKPGCYGASAYLIHIDGQHHSENVQEIIGTTNNRAELQAIINGLQEITSNSLDKNNKITIKSDSEYCIKGMREWMHSWKRTGWRKKDSHEMIANYDLWETLYDLVTSIEVIDFQWVKGHDNNEYNNYVNDLCTAKQEQMKLTLFDQGLIL